MGFEAQTTAVPGIVVTHSNEAILPPRRQNGGVFRNAMSVIAERLMEWRTFANRTVNQLGVRRVAKCKYICFDGNQQFSGRMGELTKYGLASDDYNFRRTSNAGGGADDVFKLRALHGGNVA